MAASAEARGKACWSCSNDEINAAREVTKTDALRLSTFKPAATASSGWSTRIASCSTEASLRRHTMKSEFDVTAAARALPRVDVILVYQGADGDLIKAAADARRAGDRDRGSGRGATSGTQQEALTYALKKGVFVVTTTRAGSGRIAPPRRGPDARRAAATAAARDVADRRRTDEAHRRRRPGAGEGARSS